MTHADRLRGQLAAIFEMKYQRQGKTLSELSQNIGVTKGYISGFLNGTLARPSAALLTRIERFVKRNSITPRDERLIVDILKLLDRADDADSILAAILLSRGGR